MTPPPVATTGNQQPDRRRRAGAVGVVILALLGFAAFFVGFLLAPLLLLLIFSLAFAARNRSSGPEARPAGDDGPQDGLAAEALARREAIARQPGRRHRVPPVVTSEIPRTRDTDGA
ncbi:MAG: hypothetical protein QOF77_2162 [Solirubrobacteraceae bacterium]|jgi:hypothetical protein|nr:hypothetical protein [Solirubrobacteraceae bacterium]